MDIWRSLRLIKSQSALFILSSLVAFALIMVAPALGGKKLLVYQSAAKILITPNIAPGGGDSGGQTVKTWFADEATLRTLLASQDLLDLVIENTHTSSTWTQLRDQIKLSILSNSQGQVSLMEIAVLGQSPEEVRVLCLTLSQSFIQYVQQLSAAEHDKTVAFLERERRNAEREVARSQKKLLNLGIIPREAGRQDPIEQAWVALQDRRSELEKEATLAEVELEQSEVASDGQILPSGTGGPLQQAVAEEQIKLAQLRDVYTERSPQVQQQLAKLKRLEGINLEHIGKTMATVREGAERKKDKIRSLLHETERRLKKLEASRPSPEKHLEYATQERQLAMWQENLLDLTRQLYRARVLQQSSRREGAFTIVEKPQPGRAVSGMTQSGSPLTRLLMAVPMSLICGLGVLMGLDYFSSSMRLSPRIEESLGLPIIGALPAMPNELVTEWDMMKSGVRRPTTPPKSPAGD